MKSFNIHIIGVGGQGIGLAHDIPTLKELFDRMAREAEQALSRLKAA